MAELLLGVGAVLAGLGSLASWRQTKRNSVDIQTNHGKRPGEYLEMIGDIHKLLVDHVTDSGRHLN